MPPGETIIDKTSKIVKRAGECVFDYDPATEEMIPRNYVYEIYPDFPPKPFGPYDYMYVPSTDKFVPVEV